jgi:hypothetical protein
MSFPNAFVGYLIALWEIPAQKNAKMMAWPHCLFNSSLKLFHYDKKRTSGFGTVKKLFVDFAYLRICNILPWNYIWKECWLQRSANCLLHFGFFYRLLLFGNYIF